MQPTISVLMSVYNSSSYLSETIDSVLAQKFTDFEFLIVDDASSDNSREILQKYADPRIRLFFNTENRGLTASLNFLIEKASGKYLARIDSDDIAMPERFAKQVAMMEHDSELLLLGANCVFVNEKSELINGGAPFIAGEKDLDDEFLRWSFLFPENLIVHSSVMLRSEILLENGLRYDESQKYAQDIEFWRRLAPYGKFRILAEPLIKLRILDGSITSKKNADQVAVGIRCALRQQAELTGGGPLEDQVSGPRHLLHLYKSFCQLRPAAQSDIHIREDLARRFVKEAVLAVRKQALSLSDFLRLLKFSGLGCSELGRSAWQLVAGKLSYLLHEKRKITQPDNRSR